MIPLYDGDSSAVVFSSNRFNFRYSSPPSPPRSSQLHPPSYTQGKLQLDEMALLGSLFLALIAALVALLAPTVIHLAKIGGPFLTPNPTILGEGQGPIVIEDTIHCEDVHHYRPANLLFTACEDSKATRFDWFPGLGHLKPDAAGKGSIHVVDPQVS